MSLEAAAPHPEGPSLLTKRVESVLAIPLHRFLGVALAKPDEPAQGIVVEVGDASINNAAVLHGGVMTALLDVACYLAVLPHLGPDENAVTHDLSASILRPVPAGAGLEVRGRVMKLGRSTVFTRAEATVGDDVVAMATVTKTRVRVPPDGRL